jgi:L-threonylcarbamoyladenylate synthase
METRIVEIDPGYIEKDKIGNISGVLKRDGLIVYPTDTFYGLGVNCFSEKGVQRIYELKKREAAKPLLVVISNLSMLDELIDDIPPIFDRLSTEFWPGPLTMIFRASPRLPKALLGDTETIGVRLPDFSWLKALIDQAGFPLTATSANPSGKSAIALSKEVIQVFAGKVDLIVDAGRTSGKLPSTVLDLTKAKPEVLREGAVSAVKLRDYLI